MYNFDKMCRTCLSAEKDDGSGAILAPVFGETSPQIHTGEKNIVDIVALITDVEVHDDARYPQNICTMCVADIERAYKFKLKCEQSDLFLRQEIDNDKSLKPRKRLRLQKSFGKHKLSDSAQSSTQLNDPEPGPSSAKTKRKFSEENILKSAFEHAVSDDDNNKDSSNVQYEEIFLDVIDDKLTIVSSNQCKNIDSMELSDILVKDESIHEKNYLDSELEDMSEEYSLNAFDETLQLDCVKEEPQLNTTNYSKDDILESDGNARLQIIPGENFSTQADLRMVDKKCRCHSCGIDLKGIAHYKQHFIEKHTQGQYCMICKKEFISNMWCHSGRHLQVAKLESEFRCTKCGKSFLTNTGLEAHETRNHMQCILCIYCSEEFQDRDAYNEHRRTHLEKNPSELRRCNICNKEVKGLYLHRKVHSDSRPYGCDICTHRFKSRAHLKQHLSFGHRTKCKANCELCKFSEDLKNV